VKINIFVQLTNSTWKSTFLQIHHDINYIISSNHDKPAEQVTYEVFVFNFQ